MNYSTMDLLEDIIPIDDFWAEYYELDPSSALTTKGVCIIIDIRNLQAKIMRYATPHNVKKILHRIQAEPVKEYTFHVVNNSLWVHTAVKILWRFLPESIKNAVSFQNIV